MSKSYITKWLSFLTILNFFLVLSNRVYAEDGFLSRHDVQEFIQYMVQKNHFDRTKLTKIFAEVKVRPQIMQRMNKPFEKQPWLTYQMLFVTKQRIQKGVEFWQKHQKTLSKAEAMFGVPACIIVATIGIETKYGERKGDFRVIDSLTNIAFSDSPRAAFFRKELEQFLLLTREEKLDPLKILGSYAGAIGQPQFMPSSYRHYAINFSKSGKTDLMDDEVDVIGSIANYYKKNGWETNGPVAIRAFKLGSRYNYLKSKQKIEEPLTVANAARLGLITKTNKLSDSLKVKVIELESNYAKEYWLGFHNFDVIKRYNSSDLYAMAVYQLSTFIDQARQKQLDQKAKLERKQRKALARKG